MKILFIIQYDSFLKTIIPIIKYIDIKKINYKIILLNEWYKKNWINEEIVQILSNYKYDIVKSNWKIYKYLNKEFNICVFGTPGKRFILKFSNYIINKDYCSKIVTGYIGLTYQTTSNQVSFIKGVKRRSKSNLVFLPGIKTKKEILNTNLINTTKTKLITGLPRFQKLNRIIKNNKITNNILFIEQPIFPKTKEERELLIKQLIKYANENPDMNIIIKPRFSKKVGHAHRPKFLLQDILKSMNPPKNIIIKYEDLYKLFTNIDMSLTISSTAGLESMYLGIPTYFINDFCKNKNKYGTDYFNDLNAVINFKNLFEKSLPKINFSKVNDYIDFKNSINNKVAKEILKLND
tara:strand:- start:1477 stop:2526 length:1050 start_codon:yes stop_codon:yes gene_type:complete